MATPPYLLDLLTQPDAPSQSRVAQLLGVSKMAISKWTRGEAPVPPARYSDLVSILLFGSLPPADADALIARFGASGYPTYLATGQPRSWHHPPHVVVSHEHASWLADAARQLAGGGFVLPVRTPDEIGGDVVRVDSLESAAALLAHPGRLRFVGRP